MLHRAGSSVRHMRSCAAELADLLCVRGLHCNLIRALLKNTFEVAFITEVHLVSSVAWWEIVSGRRWSVTLWTFRWGGWCLLGNHNRLRVEPHLYVSYSLLHTV